MKSADMTFDSIYRTYKRIGRIQAREKLLSLTVPELTELCYFVHLTTEGTKTKLVDKLMSHMDVTHNLTNDSSVEFFDF